MLLSKQLRYPTHSATAYSYTCVFPTWLQRHVLTSQTPASRPHDCPERPRPPGSGAGCLKSITLSEAVVLRCSRDRSFRDLRGLGAPASTCGLWCCRACIGWPAIVGRRRFHRRIARVRFLSSKRVLIWMCLSILCSFSQGYWLSSFFDWCTFVVSGVESYWGM